MKETYLQKEDASVF